MVFDRFRQPIFGIVPKGREIKQIGKQTDDNVVNYNKEQTV